MIIFDADDPLVLAHTYDREGYKPGERARIEHAKAKQQQLQQRCDHKFIDSTSCLKCGWTPDEHAGKTSVPPKGNQTMRFFDDDHIGVYLDAIDHRVEKTKDGKETKMVDLTLRVQPFTPELATSLDPDVRALLFNLSDAQPKAKLKAIHFALTIPRQLLTIHLLPEVDARIVLADVEITGVRARTEKGVDGYGLVFYAAYGPASPADLEYVCDWHTQQRFVTFHAQAPALDFGAPSENVVPAVLPPRRRGRQPGVQAGDELRPGVHAEH